MSNLIDKQAAIDLWDKYHPTIAVDAMQYDAELRQMPSAQPKTGKWSKNYSVIRCSECKRSSWSLSFEDLVRSFNYCPNCGAKMEGD